MVRRYVVVRKYLLSGAKPSHQKVNYSLATINNICWVGGNLAFNERLLPPINWYVCKFKVLRCNIITLCFSADENCTIQLNGLWKNVQCDTYASLVCEIEQNRKFCYHKHIDFDQWVDLHPNSLTLKLNSRGRLVNPGSPLANAVPQPKRALDKHDVLWSLASTSMRLVSKS